jgi:ATP-dependent RNA helicase RhlE
MPSYYSTKPRRYNSSNNRHFNSRPAGRSKGPAKQYIHPSKFVRAAAPQAEIDYVPTNTFAGFDINPVIKSNITSKGFVNLSPIQDRTIPLALAGQDVIGIANTGTGKTAAFGIPVLNRLMSNSASKVLILAPTRELAQQIDEELKSLSKGGQIFSVLLIGGVGIGPQIRDLSRNPRIIIGTPGRIKDHMARGTLKLHNVDQVVLDEVDRMLDLGFINDIRRILSELPHQRQSLFFSATLNPKVEELIKQFSIEPVTVSIKTESGSENVNQDIISYLSKEEQIAKLHSTLNEIAVEKVIIFDETKRSVDRLSKELISRGFAVEAIHGGKSQGQRRRALAKFKTNQISILVATDVAARGIDVVDITHVINYSTPQTYQDYIHRIGRAGRAGKIGHALTFVPAEAHHAA